MKAVIIWSGPKQLNYGVTLSDSEISNDPVRTGAEASASTSFTEGMDENRHVCEYKILIN